VAASYFLIRRFFRARLFFCPSFRLPRCFFRILFTPYQNCVDGLYVPIGKKATREPLLFRSSLRVLEPFASRLDLQDGRADRADKNLAPVLPTGMMSHFKR